MHDWSRGTMVSSELTGGVQLTKAALAFLVMVIHPRMSSSGVLASDGQSRW